METSSQDSDSKPLLRTRLRSGSSNGGHQLENQSGHHDSRSNCHPLPSPHLDVKIQLKRHITLAPSSPLPAPLQDKVKKRKRIPYTLVEASKGNHCPTPDCDGMGHLTGMYAMHFAVSGCPKAHGKTPAECRARREELNRLKSKTLSVVNFQEANNTPVVERPARRTSRLLSNEGAPPAPPATALTSSYRKTQPSTLVSLCMRTLG